MSINETVPTRENIIFIVSILPIMDLFGGFDKIFPMSQIVKSDYIELT